MGEIGWKKMEGKWQVDKNENFDEYLKALGVNMLIRKMANSSKSVIQITVEGDQLTIQAVSSWMKQEPNTFHGKLFVSFCYFLSSNIYISSEWS